MQGIPPILTFSRQYRHFAKKEKTLPGESMCFGSAFDGVTEMPRNYARLDEVYW